MLNLILAQSPPEPPVKLPPMPFLACVARSYEAGQSAKSQVWIASLDGKKKIRLTNSETDCGMVRWVGRDRLLFTTDHPKTDEQVLWVMKLIDQKPIKLASAKSIIFRNPENVDARPGQPKFWLNQDPDDPNSRVRIINSSGKITFAPELESPWIRAYRDGALNFGETVTLDSASEDQPGSLLIEGGDEPILSWSKGEEKGKIELEGTLRSLVQDPERNLAWLFTRDSDSTVGMTMGLFRFDWKTMKTMPIIKRAHDYHFWPTAKRAAFCPPPSLAPLGKKKVWMAPAYILDPITGKSTKVVGGQVHVTSVSLPPDK